MKTSGIENILNGLLAPKGSTEHRISAIADLYQDADAKTKTAIALQLARVAITSGEVVSAVCGNK